MLGSWKITPSRLFGSSAAPASPLATAMPSPVAPPTLETSPVRKPKSLFSSVMSALSGQNEQKPLPESELAFVALVREWEIYSNQVATVAAAVIEANAAFTSVGTTMCRVSGTLNSLSDGNGGTYLQETLDAYRRASDSLHSSVVARTNESIAALLLVPLEAILRSHGELRTRIQERQRLSKDYDKAAQKFASLQRKAAKSSRKKRPQPTSTRSAPAGIGVTAAGSGVAVGGSDASLPVGVGGGGWSQTVKSLLSGVSSRSTSSISTTPSASTQAVTQPVAAHHTGSAGVMRRTASRELHPPEGFGMTNGAQGDTAFNINMDDTSLAELSESDGEEGDDAYSADNHSHCDGSSSVADSKDLTTTPSTHTVVPISKHAASTAQAVSQLSSLSASVTALTAVLREELSQSLSRRQVVLAHAIGTVTTAHSLWARGTHAAFLPCRIQALDDVTAWYAHFMPHGTAALTSLPAVNNDARETAMTPSLAARALEDIQLLHSRATTAASASKAHSQSFVTGNSVPVPSDTPWYDEGAAARATSRSKVAARKELQRRHVEAKGTRRRVPIDAPLPPLLVCVGMGGDRGGRVHISVFDQSSSCSNITAAPVSSRVLSSTLWLQVLCGYLDVRDLGHMECVCQCWAHAFRSNHHLWLASIETLNLGTATAPGVLPVASPDLHAPNPVVPNATHGRVGATAACDDEEQALYLAQVASDSVAFRASAPRRLRLWKRALGVDGGPLPQWSYAYRVSASTRANTSSSRGGEGAGSTVKDMSTLPPFRPATVDEFQALVRLAVAESAAGAKPDSRDLGDADLSYNTADGGADEYTSRWAVTIEQDVLRSYRAEVPFGASPAAMRQLSLRSLACNPELDALLPDNISGHTSSSDMYVSTGDCGTSLSLSPVPMHMFLNEPGGAETQGVQDGTGVAFTLSAETPPALAGGSSAVTATPETTNAAVTSASSEAAANTHVVAPAAVVLRAEHREHRGMSSGAPVFGEEGMEKRRNALRAILLATAASEPTVRYTQGMANVARVLLELAVAAHNDDVGLVAQVEAFNLFGALLRLGSPVQHIPGGNDPALPNHASLISLYHHDSETLKLRLYQAHRLLLRHAPDAATPLLRESLLPAAYASSWILTLFSNFSALPLSRVARLWDAFLVDGWAQVFSWFVSVMGALHSELEGLAMEDLLRKLQAPVVSLALSVNPSRAPSDAASTGYTRDSDAGTCLSTSRGGGLSESAGTHVLTDAELSELASDFQHDGPGITGLSTI